MEREILHISVADFAVAVERVVDRELRTKAIAVATGRGTRAVIVGVSPEAREDGVHRGMLVPRAKRYCRSLLVLPPNPPLYQRAGGAIQRLAAEYCPVIEPTRPGRLFLDVTGTGRLFGPALDLGAQLQRDIDVRLRLGANLGLAVNKLVSGIAARSIRPVAFRDVPHGTEQQFLAPLPVRRLPAVGRVTERQLFELLNLRRIGHVADIAPHHLLTAFGQQGYALHEQARGIDQSPVAPPEITPHFAEQRTPAEDTNNRDELAHYLRQMTEALGARLRKRETACRVIKLTLRYSDGETYSRQTRASTLINDNATLFEKTAALLGEFPRRTRIRWLEVTVLRLSQMAPQLSLFAPKAGETRRDALSVAMDKIRARFGVPAVALGAG
jgi:DNA polymerase IV